MHEVNTIEPVWTVPWGQLADFAREDVAAGDTFRIDPFVERDGHQRDARLDTTPASVLDYRIPGRWFGLDVQSVSATAFSLQFGSRVTVSPAVGRPGESLYVQASGLGLTSAEVWISSADALDIKPRAPGISTSSPRVRWASYPSRAVRSRHGSHFRPISLHGDYSVVIGEPGGAFVPAGPLLTLDEGENAVNILYNVQLEAGAPATSCRPRAGRSRRSTRPARAGDPYLPDWPTARRSRPDHRPDSDRVQRAHRVVSRLLRAEFGDPAQRAVTVCITFDTTGMTAGDAASQHLYHYVSGAWVDITSSSSTGKVCGTTSSFSPFAIGKPLPAPPTTWPFTGFLDLSTPT